MGWWSKDIMGGDSPLDVEGKIFEICNVEQFPEDDSVGKLTKKDFEKNLAKRIGVINAYLKFQFWICNNTEIIQIIKETNYE